MEPSDTGSEPAVHDTSSKRQQKGQSASAMGEKRPQDRRAYDEPPSDDSSSSSSSVDYPEEVDEIDPDDSVSATAKQPPDHRTKRSASHQKSVPQHHQHQHRHQQPQPQSVPSFVSTESGFASPHVYPYPYNGFFGAGPQGMAGWVPPPAPHYGNAGYMPPTQDTFSMPYWQRPLYEAGKEMMPYQMWNPFAPAQGAGALPAAPVGKKSRRDLKRSRKGKKRPLSVHSLGAECHPDGPDADKGRPGKGSGKSKDDPAVLRLTADVDGVYNSADARDLTVHLELDLFRDMDDELEEFNRLVRMGNFAAADSFFESYLKEHMSSDPSIFVQYAEMLLEKGDFKSLLLLDGDSVFGKRRNDPEKSESKEPLEMNWLLVRAMALLHSQHKVHKVWSGIKAPLRGFSETSGIESTELRVFSLTMRLTCVAPDRTISRSLRKRGLSDWADWKSIYRQLLTEQRIWDFRDVLIDACVSYDMDQALSAFLDHASPIEGMIADWQTGSPDESTELALLDLLSFIALNSDPYLEDGGLAEDCLRLAEPIGNSLLDKFPHTVHSRPFIQWMVSRAVVKNVLEQFAYLSDYAGLAMFSKSAGVLPYYIPIRQENPGWVPQDLTPAARDVLEATLKASRDMNDCKTETLCLNQLALGTKDPGSYFQQLGQLQKKQHNMAGFLSTCLTRYLICRDDESKTALLEDLNSFGSWKDTSDLINPTGAAARDVFQHALSRGPARSSSPSIMSASRYSLHLPEPFRSIFRHLPRPRLAETGEEPRPPTETLRMEQQHSESEDEPQEGPENNTRSRNAHNGGPRAGNKDQAKKGHQPAVPGVYPGHGTNYYGVPPHVAQYMYSAPLPPPSEAPAPAKTPAPPEEKPDPEMVQMKQQLELLQAERKQQEESKRQADMEKKIREDAERAFKIRIEAMQRAQEEAKKEIELARAAAERAVRERMEEERRIEAEQRALIEVQVRNQLAAELKAQEEARAAAQARAAEERARREVEDAELRAEAVRAHEDKIAAEREAGEERQRREEDLRAQGAREERERMEAERRAGEEEEERGRSR